MLLNMRSFLLSALLLSNVTSFSPVQQRTSAGASTESRAFHLFMGRAAAVRAATKSKTDMKKAKTNAVYGKKIIMAVKQGGSPDPNANRMLGDIIKQAKANSVPVDVRNYAFIPDV